MGSIPQQSVSPGSRWEGADATPEVLPPAGEPEREQRRPKPSWVVAPATYVLVGINCAVFLAMLAQHVPVFSPSSDQLYQWQANNAGAVLVDGEWWRIVTAMFVHVGALHLLTNMWCLWNLGLLAEPLMGSAGVVAVYILSGAAGNLLSTLSNWIEAQPDWKHFHDIGVFAVGAGASGAVFGIAGALIVLLKSPRLPVPPEELKKLRRSVIYFAAANLVLGLSITGGTKLFGAGVLVDNTAHVGGFLGGLLFAWPMVPRVGSPRGEFRRRLMVATGSVVTALVFFSVYLAKLGR